MHVLSTRPGLGSVRTLPRTLARRWPALAVATVAVAIPAGVALADFQGQTNFLGGNFTAIEAVSDNATAIVGTSNSQFSPGISGQGNNIGVQGDGVNNGTGVEGDSFNATGVLGKSVHGHGVDAQTTDGIALDAASNLVAINAHSNPVPGNPNAVPAGSFGVVTDHVETGVEGVGSKVGVDGFSADGIGVQARSTTGTAAQATSDNGAGVFATGHGTFGTGVLASGDDVGVQGNGINVGVDGISPKGTAVSGFSSITGTGVSGQSVQGLGAEFKGGEAPLRLDPASTAGAPTSGTHKRGELYVDSKGQLFLCVADSVNGNPGTWKKVVLQ